MIHKVSTCGCSGMLNACLLMLENPTLSYFCLLLAAGSNGRFLVFSFSRCSQPWFCLLFQSLPLFYSTGTERAEPSHRTILPPAQCCKQSLCHVLDFFHKEKKKTLKRSKATFQSKVNMRPMIGCIWHKKKYVLPVDQVRRLRYQLHFLLKATRLSWG